MEGTVAALLSTFLMCGFFSRFAAPIEWASWPQVLLACVLSALLEGFTTQHDNLVLPLFFDAIVSLNAPNINAWLSAAAIV